MIILISSRTSCRTTSFSLHLLLLVDIYPSSSSSSCLILYIDKEALRFSADLRLRNSSNEEKIIRVKYLIKELGLSKCKDTRIGGAMIRGVSGGERKRTSIGVELLTNPSVVFLDEPTTGLDSSTAL